MCKLQQQTICFFQLKFREINGHTFCFHEFHIYICFRCQRLQLTSLSYLWRRNQEELLDEMIDSGIKAVVIKVASLDLDEKTLG